MDDRTKTKPARAPHRARPVRHRTHRTEPPHGVRKADDVEVSEEAALAKTEMQGGGGAFGGGPGDDDGHRKPDRDGDDAARRLLIALGILALGAGVMSARLLSRNPRTPRIS